MASTDINGEPILVLGRADVVKLYKTVMLWPWWAKPVKDKIEKFLKETKSELDITP